MALMPTSLGTALSVALRHPGVASETVLTAARAELERLSEVVTDRDLALADRQAAGDTPLLGTSSRTDPYPALLWNGERFERLDATWPARLAFLTLATAGGSSDHQRAGRAIQVGEAVRRSWPDDPTNPVAGLSTASVAAAVCAAIAEGVADDDLEMVAEIAASLMLVTPLRPAAGIRESHAGHELASGWLAVQLFLAGLVAAPGTSSDVLKTREAP
jgi:hypothetical protein